MSRYRTRAVKLEELSIQDHSIFVLAILDYDDLMVGTSLRGVNLKIIVDGNVDDEILFALNWENLFPKTVDEGRTDLQNDLFGEDPLSPRALVAGSKDGH